MYKNKKVKPLTGYW